MRCLKCGHDMIVTHSYDAGPGGQTQRLECSGCSCIATARTLIMATDPEYGQGAAAVARRMKNAHDDEVERHDHRERLGALNQLPSDSRNPSVEGIRTN